MIHQKNFKDITHGKEQKRNLLNYFPFFRYLDLAIYGRNMQLNIAKCVLNPEDIRQNGSLMVCEKE